jgi:hypothetical protein
VLTEITHTHTEATHRRPAARALDLTKTYGVRDATVTALGGVRGEATLSGTGTEVDSTANRKPLPASIAC